MTPRADEKIYHHFNELIALNKSDDKNAKETSKELFSLIENQMKEIIIGFVLTMLEKNIKEEIDHNNKEYSFFVFEYDIIRSLTDSSLILKAKDDVHEKVNEIVSVIPNLTERNYNKEKLFKSEMLFDVHTNSRVSYLFYYDHNDKWLGNGYIDIYKRQLLKELGQLYSKPNINNQINPERFQMCSADNFAEKNALQEIDFQNVQKLVDRFVKSVKEGKKIIVENDIILCHKIKVIQDIIHFSHTFIKEEPKETPSAEQNVIHQTEEVVRNAITHLLKGSTKQSDYVGFFTKNDYIEWVFKKHKTLPKERIADIFDSVTWPKPPIGVTRFVVPATKEHEKLTYFISLDNVSQYYRTLQLSKKDFNMSSQISQRHFLLFLKKLFRDFKTSNYSYEKMASTLNCSVSHIKSMQESAEKLT